MKKRLLLLGILACHSFTYAADLVEVYQQALHSDPLYQQAIAQRLATKEGLPISIATLLPSMALTGNPTLTRSGFAGANFRVDADTGVPLTPRNNTSRTYDLVLSVNQTIFDFGKFASVAGYAATSKGADATLNAELQNLIIRVANAYLAILRDVDNLSYSEASKVAYAQQLDQVKQQFNVGLKTITDVYTAQASYDSALAKYIAAQTILDNDRENLRVITGKYYPHLSQLSDHFPLLTPQPANIDVWSHVALRQNWSIRTAQYSVDTARATIRQQFAGHLPTVNINAGMDRQYIENINGYSSLIQRDGPGTQTDRFLTLNLNMPIFSGGSVIAKTNQAIYNYQVAEQQLEQTARTAVNNARQSYLSIISGISQIKADRQAIISSISSLQGMIASYRVGTETLVDVLNQQEKVFEAQTAYSADRYAFVSNFLALKQAAGTLGFEDLRALNQWLIDKPRIPASSKYVAGMRQLPIDEPTPAQKLMESPDKKLLQ